MLACSDCTMKFLAAPRPHGGLTICDRPVAAPHCLTPKARNVAGNRNKYLKVGLVYLHNQDCNWADVVPEKGFRLPSQLGEGVRLSCAGT